jgi:hypothetical protein
MRDLGQVGRNNSHHRQIPPPHSAPWRRIGNVFLLDAPFVKDYAGRSDPLQRGRLLGLDPGDSAKSTPGSGLFVFRGRGTPAVLSLVATQRSSHQATTVAGLARNLWTPEIRARMRPGGIHEPETAAGVHGRAEVGRGGAREEHGQDGVPGSSGLGPGRSTQCSGCAACWVSPPAGTTRGHIVAPRSEPRPTRSFWRAFERSTNGRAARTGLRAFRLSSRLAVSR